MQHASCEQCRQSHPTKEMFLAFGRSLCAKCADADLARRRGQKVPEGSVTRQTDPTVCAGCGRDNGSSPLPKLGGGLPVCPACDRKFRNQPFPGWIKTAVTALLLLAALSCFHQWRFFEAYRDIRRGIRSAGAQDLESAVAFLDSANRRVPESQTVAGAAAYFRGLRLLSQDKAAEALPHLRRASAIMPQDRTVQDYVLLAQVGVAFDQKDYDRFLAWSKILMERNPRDPTVVAGVASAFACKWAMTGEQHFKREALTYLDQARKLAGAQNASFREYEGRITYRLDSREIISREEYQRRFPNGYWRSEDTP